MFCEMTEILKACQNALNFRYSPLNVGRLNLSNFTAGFPAGGDGRKADQADVDTAGDGTDWDERPAGADIVIEVAGGVSCRLSRSPSVVIVVGLTIPASVAVIVFRRIVFKMAKMAVASVMMCRRAGCTHCGCLAPLLKAILVEIHKSYLLIHFLFLSWRLTSGHFHGFLKK